MLFMSTWLWVNLALGAPFVLAVVGVPLWLVVTRPDAGPHPRRASRERRRHVRARAAAATSGRASRAAAAQPGQQVGPPAPGSPAVRA